MADIITFLKHQKKISSRYMHMVWKMKQNWYSKTATQAQNTAYFFPSENSK